MSGKHISIIPDGNRRWAKKQAERHLDREPDPGESLSADAVRGWLREHDPEFVDRLSAFERSEDLADADALLKAYGHWQSANQMARTWEWVSDLDVSEVSLWGLSRDNIRKRDDSEIAFLNFAYRELLRELNREGSVVHQDGVEVRFHGDTSLVDDDLAERARTVQRETADYDGGRLTLLFGYDGIWDIAQATAAATLERVEDAVRNTDHESIPVDEVATMVSESLTDDPDAVASEIREYHVLSEIDVLLAYGPDRTHLSHFANWQVGQATLYFPIKWSELTVADLADLQDGAAQSEILPKKHWPESTATDVANALRSHERRSKTRGA